jgi:hypothetical protein
MCPSVPRATIATLTNTINGHDWNPSPMMISGLPKGVFPKRTLRFDGCDEVKRIVPCAMTGLIKAGDGGKIALDQKTGYIQTVPMTWYDLTYKFSWRTIFDFAVNAYGEVGDAPVWVNWNCVWQRYHSAFHTIAGWQEAAFEFAIATYKTKYTDAETAITSNPLTRGIADDSPFDALFYTASP